MPPKRKTATPATTTATPVRTTRARSKTPLPSIDPKQSYAYGAQGKATLTSQLRTTTGEGFSQAFASNRNATQGADIEQSESSDSVEEEPAPRRQGVRPSHTITQQTIPEEEVPEMATSTRRRAPTPARPEVSFTGRNATALDTSAQYTGVTSRVRGEMRRRVHDPSTLMVFFHTLPRYLREIMNDTNTWLKWLILLFLAFLFVLLGFLFAHIPLSTRLAAARANVGTGLDIAFGNQPFDQEPVYLAKMWYQFKHDHIFSHELPHQNIDDPQYAININLLTRLEKVESALAMEKSDLEEIRRMLPSMLVLEVKDGQYAIPENFWQALQSRVAGNSDSAPMWQGWLLRNEMQAEELVQQYISSALDREMEKRRVVSKDTFLEVLQQNNDRLMMEYSEQVLKLWRESAPGVEAHAKQAVNDAVENSAVSTLRQLDVLLRAKELQNLHEALHEVNWFSVGMGSRINPLHTSPTAARPQNWIAYIYNLMNPRYIPPNSPLTALTTWDEAADCWCANLSATRSAQVAVQINKKIYPITLVVEHVPAKGTIDIQAAPKDIEIWADVGNKTEVERFQKVLDANKVWLNCGEAPAESFLCVHTGVYDIHKPNHVQSFTIALGETEIGLATDRMVVRASSNWGAEHTCFYRLRMTGDEIVEIEAPGT
ncbi:hypothetical protein LTR37_007500 [Vermiconidia calcicola]|uniref:Uncharacterized protein n=1 Tax=Vermiconidia calcicola TaxID=1690605 RepID=A0ACC3NDT6_9PEZI|nr:hypothetical protein LTR37_007500 [Vermiconidia calcicola]